MRISATLLLWSRAGIKAYAHGGGDITQARDLMLKRCSLVAALCLAISSESSAQTGPDPIVATVAGEPVLRSEVVAELSALPAHYRDVPVERLYPVVLNRLIDQRLLLAEALQLGLDKDPQVERRLQRARNRIIQEVFLDRHVRAQVTAATVRDSYRDFAENRQQNRKVRLRQILVDTEPDARRILAELVSGGDFGALARQHSIGPRAADGGDLGFVGPADVVPTVAAAVFELPQGGMAPEPVQSPFGWHVLRVEEIRDTEAPSFEQVEEQLTTALSKRAIANLLQGLRRRASIERFAMDGSPAPPGLFDAQNLPNWTDSK